MKEHIYLDYAATTPVDNDVIAAALPYYNKIFYNPSSTHALGQQAATAVEVAREKCAKAINANSDEIYFTSGGTEAINWAMSTVRGGQKKHVVVSAIEHDAVLACAQSLENVGYIVDYAKSDRFGLITPNALEKVISNDTALVCVMTVNNIVGSIQPVSELVEIAHKHGALFFTDAVQAVNSVELDVKNSGVDMLAVSGHKFYAHKGVGFLYVKRGALLSPLILGGAQERGKRGGTVDVPSVVGLGVAIEKATRNRSRFSKHVKQVVDEFVTRIKYGYIVKCDNKTDDIVTLIVPKINGGRIAVALSCAGVCCSVGSACSAGSATPPKTLVEMGEEYADCAVRFSFGRDLTIDRVVRAADIVNDVISRFKAD